MPRRAAIAALAATLDAASAARDWTALHGAVIALGPQLNALAARGAWSAAELRALKALRAVHDKAALDCAAEQELLESQLNDLNTNQAGFIAYALGNDTDTELNQATP